jgi:alkylation response protein AidB-like acyl-CoA dehydrogenase
VRLQDVVVPASNLLGEVGKGHKIAFNVLNFARFKLGAMCVGGARGAIGESARYAADRRQFGHPIASFGAIKHKLGAMITRTYAVESLIYRTAGMIDERIAQTPHDPTDSSASLAAFEEYAAEASIAKVTGSEMLDFVLDENIQIHGGNGFVREYGAERHYRDSRVNRIFEGTNEINRLLIPAILTRRAMAGDLAVLATPPDLATLPAPAPARNGDWLSEERHALRVFKNVTRLVFGLAMRTFGEALADQQEVLLHTADMLMNVYGSESALLRAAAAQGSRVPADRAALHVDAARLFMHDAALDLHSAGSQALAVMLQDEELDKAVAALRTALSRRPINAAAARRRLADAAVSRGGYPF